MRYNLAAPDALRPCSVFFLRLRPIVTALPVSLSILCTFVFVCRWERYCKRAARALGAHAIAATHSIVGGRADETTYLCVTGPVHPFPADCVGGRAVVAL